MASSAINKCISPRLQGDSMHVEVDMDCFVSGILSLANVPIKSAEWKVEGRKLVITAVIDVEALIGKMKEK